MQEQLFSPEVLCNFRCIQAGQPSIDVDHTVTNIKSKSLFNRPSITSSRLIKRLLCVRGDQKRVLVRVWFTEICGLWRMEDEKRETSDDRGGGEKAKSVGDDEALKKCLEENKGDGSKCRSVVEAFKTSSPTPKRPTLPLRLRSGSLTDV
ncbi:hypothetical protein RJ639_010601 [Escallonia herrerae]|uniref:Uncharacterized protein n=1 Tax=Escallonia herrerae TaxID=1293975 RepID=A0AA89AQG0_9ASTE|nr:hypothetical protein RJ639_010601 [Escallonia herrerae]